MFLPFKLHRQKDSKRVNGKDCGGNERKKESQSGKTLGLELI